MLRILGQYMCSMLFSQWLAIFFSFFQFHFWFYICIIFCFTFWTQHTSVVVLVVGWCLFLYHFCLLWLTDDCKNSTLVDTLILLLLLLFLLLLLLFLLIGCWKVHLLVLLRDTHRQSVREIERERDRGGCDNGGCCWW